MKTNLKFKNIFDIKNIFDNFNIKNIIEMVFDLSDENFNEIVNLYVENNPSIKNNIISLNELNELNKNKILNKFADQLNNNLTSFDSKHTFLFKLRNKILSTVLSEKDKWSSYAAGIVENLINILKFFEYSKTEDIYSFYNFVNFHIDKKLYSDKLKVYNKSDLELFESYIDFSREFKYEYYSSVVISRGYFQNNICENIQYIYMIAALVICSKENDKELRNKLIKEFYDALSLKKISLGTPILLNLRKNKINSLASCFILKLDDTIESILYGVFSTGVISKSLGGVGLNISRLRATGTKVANTKGASCGVNAYMKLFNDCAVAFSQNGLRNSAVTVSLDIWHKDIIEFLHSQDEVGDQRSRCYDIFPQIVVEDEFMKRLEENKKWYLFCPKEIKDAYNFDIDLIYGKEFSEKYNFLENEILENRIKTTYIEVDPDEIFKIILERQIESGLPYIFFKSTVNNVNPNPHVGMIPGGNLCMESFTSMNPLEITPWIESKRNEPAIGNKSHVCNLVSVNLSEIINYKDIDVICETSVKILNYVIDLDHSITKDTSEHNKTIRAIGVGFMGFADNLVLNKQRYKDSVEYINILFEKIALASLSASCKLAKDIAPYPAFKGSQWEKGIYFGKNINDILNTTEFKKEWQELDNNIKKYGLRNGNILAIAPNTNTSLIHGCSASVLPIYNNFFIEANAKGAIPNLSKYGFLNSEIYCIYSEIKQQDTTKIISTIQSWIDQGISYELFYNLSKNIKFSDLKKDYFHIWRNKVKTIYYVRTKTLRVENDICESCSL